MPKGEKTPKVSLDIRVGAVMFRMDLLSQVDKQVRGENVILDGVAVRFKKKGGVEVVQLGLTKFVHYG
jgi:hypothetical protein